jgi:chromate reductase
MSSRRLRIFALSGSLRKNSSSSYILKNLGSILEETCDVEYFDGVALLPHFDDALIAADVVINFRKKIHESDGVIISQPEYAFGVSGSLKNALDWTVGSGEFSQKPVALVTAATGGENAHEAMLKTLGAIDCLVSPDTTLLISFIKSKLDTQGVVKDELVRRQLQSLARSFVTHVTSNLNTVTS